MKIVPNKATWRSAGISILSGILILVVYFFIFLVMGGSWGIVKFTQRYFYERGYMGMAGWVFLACIVVLSILSGIFNLKRIKPSWILVMIFLQFVFFVYANPIEIIMTSDIMPTQPNYQKLKIPFYFHSVTMLIIEMLTVTMCVSILSPRYKEIFTNKIYPYIFMLLGVLIAIGTILFQLYFLVLAPHLWGVRVQGF